MRVVALICLSLIAFSCTSKKDQTDFSKLDAWFASQYAEDEPGGAVMVVKGDDVIFSGAWGLADLNTREKVTLKTLFNLGSVSKTFVANAILQLRNEGKLSLEDSLIKYFPDFINKSIGEKVKIKNLLTHTSGLPDIRFPYRDSVYYLTALDAENWAPILKTDSLSFEPGTSFEYSNPAFNALALIIEKVSGTKWQTYIKERILDPSEMLSSTITDGAHPESGVAHGYIFSTGKWIEKDYMEEPTFAASGNGGVWSSVEELVKYEMAIRNHIFLDSLTIAESRTIQKFNNWRGATPEFIGWSWFITKNKSGLTQIGHTGSQGGFRANYVTMPEKDWLVVILSGAPRDLEQQVAYVIDFLENQKSDLIQQ